MTAIPPQPPFVPPPPAYAAHQAFIRRAGSLTEPWRTALGAVLFVLGYILLPTLVAVILIPQSQLDGYFDGTTRLGVLLQFASMIIPIAVLRIILARVHGRGLWSAVGKPTDAVSMGLAVAKTVFVVAILQTLLPPWSGSDAAPTLRPILPWLATLPFAVGVVLIQVSSEELFFRGYLQQQIAATNPHPFAWMVLPSVFFGMLHYLNADGPAEGVMWVLWAIAFGLACADLTARSGNLGPAIALHLVNNLIAILFFSMEGGPMSGLALVLSPYVEPSSVNQDLGQLLTPAGLVSIAAMGMQVAVMWLAARLAIRR